MVPILAQVARRRAWRPAGFIGALPIRCRAPRWAHPTGRRTTPSGTSRLSPTAKERRAARASGQRSWSCGWFRGRSRLLSVPLHQRALLVEYQKAPRQLDHAGEHADIARLPFLARVGLTSSLPRRALFWNTNLYQHPDGPFASGIAEKRAKYNSFLTSSQTSY